MNPFLLRRIRGPVFLLCFALTAILNQWGILSFGDSWPLYLITAGLLRIAEGAVFALATPVVFAGLPVRRRSLTGGVFLLLIGIVALLLTTGAIPSGEFWGVYAHWWPLLLVLLGVLLLVERVFERTLYARGAALGTPYAAYGRVRGRGLGGLIVLLVVLGLVSHAGSHHWDGAPFGENYGWHFPPSWDFSLGGPAFTHDVTLQQPIATGAALTINNARGDVEISASNDDAIHVQAHQVAHVPEHSQERAFASTRPQLRSSGETATLTVPGRDGVDVQLQIQVPATVQCSVHTVHGDVAVSGLARPLDLTDSHGTVTLDSLGAGAHLHLDHGDVTARSVKGDVAIDGQADDVSLSEIGGAALLRGEFFGDTELDGIGGAVAFHSSRTNLDLAHLAGSLTLDSDDLRIAGASGGLRLSTRSKDIQIDKLAGDATLSDSNGDIHAQLAQPLGTLSLTDSTGDISVSVPPASSFSVDGVTGSDDTIETDFPLVQSTEGGSKMLRGEVGRGGPVLTLHTEHGDLSVRRGSAAVAEPQPVPAAVLPRHMRHLPPPAAPPSPTVQ